MEIPPKPQGSVLADARRHTAHIAGQFAAIQMLRRESRLIQVGIEGQAVLVSIEINPKIPNTSIGFLRNRPRPLDQRLPVGIGADLAGGIGAQARPDRVRFGGVEKWIPPTPQGAVLF